MRLLQTERIKACRNGEWLGSTEETGDQEKSRWLALQVYQMGTPS